MSYRFSKSIFSEIKMNTSNPLLTTQIYKEGSTIYVFFCDLYNTEIIHVNKNFMPYFLKNGELRVLVRGVALFFSCSHSKNIKCFYCIFFIFGKIKGVFLSRVHPNLEYYKNISCKFIVFSRVYLSNTGFRVIQPQQRLPISVTENDCSYRR